MILILTLWAIYFASHSFLADDKVKSLIKAQSNSLWRVYRIIYNLISIAGFGIIGWMHFNFNGKILWESGTWNLITGVVIIGFGTAILVAALLKYDLGEFSGFSPPEQTTAGLGELNTSGLNSIVRHPLYLGIVIILLGLIFVSPQYLNLFLFIEVFVYLMIGIRLEEKKLVKEFGQSYKEYQQKVKMLIPFIL